MRLSASVSGYPWVRVLSVFVLGALLLNLLILLIQVGSLFFTALANQPLRALSLFLFDPMVWVLALVVPALLIWQRAENHSRSVFLAIVYCALLMVVFVTVHRIYTVRSSAIGIISPMIFVEIILVKSALSAFFACLLARIALPGGEKDTYPHVRVIGGFFCLGAALSALFFIAMLGMWGESLPREVWLMRLSSFARYVVFLFLLAGVWASFQRLTLGIRAAVHSSMIVIPALVLAFHVAAREGLFDSSAIAPVLSAFLAMLVSLFVCLPKEAGRNRFADAVPVIFMAAIFSAGLYFLFVTVSPYLYDFYHNLMVRYG